MSNPDIDAAAAAIIAAGMRAVAQADGDVHQQELALIEQFEADFDGAPVSPAGLSGADVRQAYLRSLFMVALADGVISDEEQKVIRVLAGDMGFDDDQLESEERAVKLQFLAQFKGVTVFRDSVVRLAEDLGLSEADVEAL